MNKKLVIGCIGIVFMLVAISMASAVSSKRVEKKESPLFKVRTENAIGQEGKTKERVYNFLIRFVKNRVVFFAPHQLLTNQNDVRQRLVVKDTVYDFTCKNYYTCWGSYPCS